MYIREVLISIYLVKMRVKYHFTLSHFSPLNDKAILIDLPTPALKFLHNFLCMVNAKFRAEMH